MNIPDLTGYNERRVCCDCGHEFLTKRDGVGSDGWAVIFFRDAETLFKVLACKCGGPLHQRSTMLVLSARYNVGEFVTHLATGKVGLIHRVDASRADSLWVRFERECEWARPEDVRYGVHYIPAQ